MATPVPPVDYTSKDWAAFRDDMEDAISIRLKEWTSRSPNDFGIVLIELFAYTADILSFYGDRIANEAFLPTAVLRSSVLNIAKMLDYRPIGNIAATVSLVFKTRSGGGSVTIPAGTQVSTAPVTGQTPVIFETNVPVTIADAATGTDNQSTPILATQGVTAGALPTREPVGTSNGGLDQAFTLFSSPVIEGSQHIFVDEGSGATEWVYYDNLIDAGPDDPAYTTFTDENGILNVIFGDNVNGRVPSNGALITATYRVGGGAAGNVGSGTLITLIKTASNPLTNVTGVNNAASAQGGADAESLDDIRVNAPRSLTTIDRAVTLADYAALAIKAGAAKAKAQAAVYTSVNLFVAPPSGDVAPIASAALKATIQNYLANRKMINATVLLMDPTYVSISISANVQVLPTFNQETVRLDAEKAVRSVLAYANSNFGDRVTVSEIYKALNGTTGVDYANVTVLSRTGTGLSDVQLADNEIPTAAAGAGITITATGGITPT